MESSSSSTSSTCYEQWTTREVGHVEISGLSGQSGQVPCFKGFSQQAYLVCIWAIWARLAHVWAGRRSDWLTRVWEARMRLAEDERRSHFYCHISHGRGSCGA